MISCREGTRPNGDVYRSALIDAQQRNPEKAASLAGIAAATAKK
jgi:hypothetical protein